MARKIALSGGIGSGKSTVAAILVELGAALIDADAIVHELQAPGTPLLAEMVGAFGAEILFPDGSLDRKGMGAIVFADDAARARLGRLVGPRVVAEMARRLERALSAEPPLAVVDIPLLFEGMRGGARGTAHFLGIETTVCVWVPRETQLERTMRRDACDRAAAEARVAAQMALDEKRALATHVIDNSGALAETRTQTEQLFAALTRPTLG